MPVNDYILLRKGSSTQWNSTDPILASGEPGYDLTNNILKIGDGVNVWSSLSQITSSDIYVYGKNGTGGPLTKGQAVYVSGVQGDHPLFGLSSAASESTSSKTLGLLKQDLNNNEFGYVVTEGLLTGLNTNSATAGDAVWLSPTTPGGLVYGTGNKPTAPNHMVFLGYVLRKNSNVGSIYIKVQNGFELGELHNVATNGTSNGQFLQYNSASGLWLASSSGNFTSLTVNDTPVPTGIGSANYVSIWKTANSLGTGVIYDNGTNVGIGTTNLNGKLCFSNGFFSSDGDSQKTFLTLRNSTTDASSTTLYADGVSSKLVLPLSSIWNFNINVSCYSLTNDGAGAWNVRGAIKRNSSTTSLVGSVIEENFIDSNLNGIGISVVANTGSYSLDINVSGLASNSIRWTAGVDLVQTIYSGVAASPTPTITPTVTPTITPTVTPTPTVSPTRTVTPTPTITPTTTVTSTTTVTPTVTTTKTPTVTPTPTITPTVTPSQSYISGQRFHFIP